MPTPTVFNPKLDNVICLSLSLIAITTKLAIYHSNLTLKGITGAREAQIELKEQLAVLETQLTSINQELDKSADLEPYVIKLLESKKKIVVINSMLQDAQNRLNRVHQNCLQETSKRRTLLEPPAANKQ